MTATDSDTPMIIAGVLLSMLALVEIYSRWENTRRTSDGGMGGAESSPNG